MACVIQVIRKSTNKPILLNIDNVQTITPESPGGCRVKFSGGDVVTIKNDIKEVALLIEQAS